MSTKKFKLGNADGNNVKGGRNNTRTILTAAGVVAFGAAAGGGGYAAGAVYGHPSPDDEEKPEPEEKTEEKAEKAEEIQAQLKDIILDLATKGNCPDDPKHKVKTSVVSSHRFNSSKFKEEHQDLYEQYCQDSESPRITIK